MLVFVNNCGWIDEKEGLGERRLLGLERDMWYGRRGLKSHEGSMSVALTEIRRQKLPNYPEPPLDDSCI